MLGAAAHLLHWWSLFLDKIAHHFNAFVLSRQF